MEDNSSAPERTEDQLDHETGERIAKSEVTRQQVCQLSCAMAKKDFIYNCCAFCVSRKGGKMEPGWMGPYRYWYSNKTNH